MRTDRLLTGSKDGVPAGAVRRLAAFTPPPISVSPGVAALLREDAAQGCVTFPRAGELWCAATERLHKDRKLAFVSPLFV